MYEALDPFLKATTWYTMHPLDEQRFFRALSTIINDPHFNADQMGEYITRKCGLDDLPHDHDYNRARDHYVTVAWAVKGYLEAIESP